MGSERTDFYYRCAKCKNAVSASVFARMGATRCYRADCPGRKEQVRMEGMTQR